ncbi:MAG: hypothetical protein IPG12_03330 [Saprospiraceae bacterium]|nr:hypothetical protein [Saprospiraceae bacterium]
MLCRWTSFASLLSNSKISKYIDSNKSILLAKSDENGKFLFQLNDSLSVGDKLKIEASGIEPLILTIDSNTISTNKLSVGMIKKSISSQKIEYPTLKLLNQMPITSNQFMPIIINAVNAIRFEVASNNDTIFRPILIVDTTTGIQLDTGFNIIIVRFISIMDTVILGKTVYYFPEIQMIDNTYNIFITSDSIAMGTKVYVNNFFYKEISSQNTIIPVLLGHNSIKFSQLGFKDVTLEIDSEEHIDLSLLLAPISHSSLTDSSIVNFPNEGDIQYRKNITVRDSSIKSIISIKQYNKDFTGIGLLPKSRTFEFCLLNSPNWSNIQTTMILDQPEDLSKDSVYLLNILGNNEYYKVAFHIKSTIVDYDSIVQKLNYNSINFKNGKSIKESLVVMKKQAPITKFIQLLSLNQNDSLKIPLTTLFCDPDSIKDDMIFEIPNSNPDGLKVSIRNGNVIVMANPCYSGPTSFIINATHDWLTVSNTITIQVIDIPNPQISVDGPTTFCQGGNVNLTSSIAKLYNWSNGKTTQSISVNVSGNYIVTITDENGCTAESSPIAVTVIPGPIVNFNQPNVNTPVVYGGCTATLDAGHPGSTYFWSTEEKQNLSLSINQEPIM